jgi:chromate reductase, NAD(P)H dehydrogenase (quinone)
MKTLAFAASTSNNSINHELASYAASFFEDTTVIRLADFEMPIFGVDTEKENGIPQKALELAALIDASDLVLISFAEHNGAYAAAFKNAFDWLSRIPNRKAWGEKKMFLMATSPGARGGASVLEMAKNRFPFNGGTVVGSFSLPSFNDNFANGKITNPELDQALQNALQLSL